MSRSLLQCTVRQPDCYSCRWCSVYYRMSYCHGDMLEASEGGTMFAGVAAVLTVLHLEQDRMFSCSLRSWPVPSVVPPRALTREKRLDKSRVRIFAIWKCLMFAVHRSARTMPHAALCSTCQPHRGTCAILSLVTGSSMLHSLRRLTLRHQFSPVVQASRWFSCRGEC